MSSIEVILRKFYNTNIGLMTMFIEKEKDALNTSTLDWIEAELNNMPFLDNYDREAVKGALLRSCFIAKHKHGLFKDNMLSCKSEDTKCD